MRSTSRAAAVITTVLALAACSVTPPQSGAKREATATPTAAPSATPSPSPSPSAAPTAAPLACKLPIASGDAPVDGHATDGNKGNGGFLTFPGGTFAKDPASMGSYDRAAAKWLPVFRAWTSPDGQHYAYPEYRTDPGPVTGIIHVVDVATSADHTVGVPAPSMPVDYEAAGVYVTRVIPNSGAPPMGLTLVDPAASSFKQITADTHAWTTVSGGSAFAADLDASDPSPPSGPGAANRILRLDIAGGGISTWFSSFGNNLQILGLDGAGNPVLGISSGSTYSVRVAGATVFSGPPADTNPGAQVVADSHGIWFGSQAGRVWLLPTGGAMQKVADASAPGGFPAGGCN